MEIREKESCGWAEVRDSLTLRSSEVLTTDTREMQLFLLGYIIVSICEIFTIGGFPLNNSVRLVWWLLLTLKMHRLTVLIGFRGRTHRGNCCDILDPYA